jgi:hypothetical protein
MTPSSIIPESVPAATPRPQPRPDPARARAWVEVDGPQLIANLAGLRAHLDAAGHPGVGILPMVKADAYGLGADAVVEALVAGVPDHLKPVGWGVATVRRGSASFAPLRGSAGAGTLGVRRGR